MKRRKKRKTSEARQKILDAYKKERSRVLRYISDMKSRGYDVMEARASVPSIPKYITEASVRALKKFDPTALRKKMYWINKETGEFRRASNRVGVAKLKKEYEQDTTFAKMEPFMTIIDNRYSKKQSRVLMKQAYYDAILDNFREEVYNSSNQYFIDYMIGWLDSWIHTDGEEFVAESIEKATNRGIRLEVYEYDSEKTVDGKVYSYIHEVLSLSGEYDETGIEDIIDAYNYDVIGGYF